MIKLSAESSVQFDAWQIFWLVAEVYAAEFGSRMIDWPRMARVFLSHSSKDKTFVRRLAEDLAAIGHEPWLDEWEIKVGECIVTKVEHGIAEADWVVVVLTPSSVSSGWVEREWKAKYWTEIGQKKTLVLPVLAEACTIPLLLQTRRYANFAGSHAVGFHELASAIGTPLIKTRQPQASTDLIPRADDEVTALLAKIHAREVTFASCVAEGLRLGALRGDGRLRSFSERELAGYEGFDRDEHDPEFPRYRLVQTFYSVTAQVNFHHFGWGGDGKNIVQMMEGDRENFSQVKTFMPQPISEVERLAQRDTSKGVLHWKRRLGDLSAKTANPDVPVWLYSRGDAFGDILEAARSELTRLLVALLPGTSTPTALETAT